MCYGFMGYLITLVPNVLQGILVAKQQTKDVPYFFMIFGSQINSCRAFTPWMFAQQVLEEKTVIPKDGNL